MTRINIIPVEDLTDQHLMAEYRELFMIGSSLQRSLKSTDWNKKRIPKKFSLNKGHVTFFYDKGKYLSDRYDKIREELKKRKFNLDDSRTFHSEKFPEGYYGDWTPSEEDMDIVRERIEERIQQKPEWYRHYGISIVQ